jgi:hypothetical protein
VEFTENNKLDKAGEISLVTENSNRSNDPNDFLDSWKEISLFLKRGIRTVQRWEATEGLPVHRHRHLKRGTVFAFASEIQGWLKTRDGEKMPRNTNARDAQNENQKSPEEVSAA